jgi:hypothetical protein
VPAVVPVMLAPIYVGIFSILTPNALDVVVWTAILLVVVHLLEAPTNRALDAPRRPLRRRVPEPPCHRVPRGGARGRPARDARTPPSRRPRAPPRRGDRRRARVPHLVWQATHGWPTLEFLANARANKMLAKSPIEFVGEQILVLDPLAAPIWMTGLVVLWRRDDGRWRPLVWAYATVLALLVAGGGKAYYLTPFYPVLFAAGAIALVERSRTLAGWRRSRSSSPASPSRPFAKPLMSEDAFVAYSRRFGIDPRTGVGERNELDVLPQQYADQHGWPELATTVAGVLKTLPREEQERTCIVTANYGEAGAIDFFGPALGLPPARSGHNNYWLWGPGDCDFSTVIAIGFDADIVRALARSVDEAATVPCPYCMPYERKPIPARRGLSARPRRALGAAQALSVASRARRSSRSAFSSPPSRRHDVEQVEPEQQHDRRTERAVRLVVRRVPRHPQREPERRRPESHDEHDDAGREPLPRLLVDVGQT